MIVYYNNATFISRHLLNAKKDVLYDVTAPHNKYVVSEIQNCKNEMQIWQSVYGKLVLSDCKSQAWINLGWHWKEVDRLFHCL